MNLYTNLPGSNLLISYFLFRHQMTLLHVAATEGRVNITECLIKKGADTNVKNVAEVSEIILPYSRKLSREKLSQIGEK